MNINSLTTTLSANQAKIQTLNNEIKNWEEHPNISKVKRVSKSFGVTFIASAALCILPTVWKLNPKTKLETGLFIAGTLVASPIILTAATITATCAINPGNKADAEALERLKRERNNLLKA